LTCCKRMLVLSQTHERHAAMSLSIRYNCCSASRVGSMLYTCNDDFFFELCNDDFLGDIFDQSRCVPWTHFFYCMYVFKMLHWLFPCTLTYHGQNYLTMLQSYTIILQADLKPSVAHAKNRGFCIVESLELSSITPLPDTRWKANTCKKNL
jgi:hypothetical protein